jgi:flagellar hook-associated protein 3 FlgL
MTTAISSQSIMSSLRQSVGRLQSEIADRTRELSTGRHSDLGLKLGSRSGISVSLRTERSALQSMTDTNSVVSGRLDTTQSKLESLQASAQDMLNSLLASNASDAHGGTIRTAGTSHLASLISELNSTLGGNFLFAGTNTGTKPIMDYGAPSSSSKQAVDAAFSVTFGFAQSSPNVSGISGAAMTTFLDTQFAALFEEPSWSDDWSTASDQELSDRISPTTTLRTSVSANETVFRQLAQAYTMLSDLGTQDLGADAYAAVADKAGELLRSAIGGLTDLRADVGLVQSDVTNANEQMSLQVDILTTQVGNLENVDIYEVTSRLTELRTQLEASYHLTAQLRDLSLVHYL